MANSTFTSRELVTTTLAVPLTAWPNGPAQSVALSADGRWIAFTAPRYITESLSIQQERGYDDLYLYDRSEGTLTRVTTAPDGAPSNGWVGMPAMVPDGRYLAFYAWASNLVPGDTNAVQDLFFYDRQAATISRLSVGADGAQANDRSGDSSNRTRPALSADGRFVAFHSAASNLTPNDNNGRVDVFLHDRQTTTTILMSHGPDGSGANGDSGYPALSADARYLLFQSRATNLDPTVPSLQGPGAYQIYLYDRTLGSTQLISRGPDGRPGDADSSTPAISGDGRYVVYASSATNLVAGDSNQVSDIFLYDHDTGETRRVSVASAGTQANRAAWAPVITLDGRYILFGAEASNLVNGDGNNAADLFLHDQLARHTSRVSVAVQGAWTGQEANGPTQGPAAIIPGGRLIAFISQATNLVDAGAGEIKGVPGLYLHERSDAPTFTLSGQVVENDGAPVANVVVAAGPHRTTTAADGRFHLTTLVGGTYTLAVAKTGYTFSPPRRTISLLRDLDSQDFLAFAGGGPDAFLDLPLFYDGTATTLLGLLRDTDEGGWIDAWFDHDSPDYRQNGSMLLWDGRLRNQGAYNDALGCYERRCYEGHDGIDFPYRDPDPSTPNIFEPLLVRPAAAGQVAAVVRGCEADAQAANQATSQESNPTDEPGSARKCNGGYGNEVILFHENSTGNGYFTRYSHLATVTVEEGAQWLTPELVLGEMGSTGNSQGTHLHFGVHQDNGNGKWDGEKVDLPVDPFGWEGSEPDPWAATEGAPVSRWLWRFNPTTEAILLGSQGATLRDGVGSVTARIPAGALAGQVRVELVTGAAVAPPASSQRSLGRAFRLQVLDWLQGGSAPNTAAARPVELSVGFAGAVTRHLDLDQLLLYQWREGAGWSPLPTVIQAEAQAVIAASNQFGDFDLQAPLLCPADVLEPDDSFDAATFATGTTTTWERLFDVAEDEDWFQVEAVAGASYEVALESLAPGVDFVVELYDRDGLTRINSRRGSGTLSWSATEAGSYFVHVAPAEGSSVGCEAGYRVRISGAG
ncbi:MAG: peptidoglycan DD-metalloendopeptidase family protein [Caldilineaceae bacterium]|nr:peptidoglycan DD-metalloendopeptidase family protein [Caldilineaceae bacterium]